MNANEVGIENHAFFYVGVGLVMTRPDFASAVRDSFERPVQYAMANSKYDGYILIDTSNVVMNCTHGGLSDDMRAGLLGNIVMKLPNAIGGEMNTEASVTHDIYRFDFKITKYERDNTHNFEMVEDPLILPRNEELGRYVELTISIAEH